MRQIDEEAHLNELEKMTELYPDTELLPFDKARELVGKGANICGACPACYGHHTDIDCGSLQCAGGKVYVSPTLYIVAKVSNWSDE
jgi:hypothetical protein